MTTRGSVAWRCYHNNNDKNTSENPKPKAETYTCLVQDDAGMYCLAEYDALQQERVGMCADCASRYRWLFKGDNKFASLDIGKEDGIRET